MRICFAALFLSGLFLGGCDKCEIQHPVTVFLDYSTFRSRLDTIPDTDLLDHYDTTQLRHATFDSYAFLNNEVMVNPTADTNAEYHMVMDSIIIGESYTHITRDENCYEEAHWPFSSSDPQDVLHFDVRGISVRMVCTFYRNSRSSPVTWHYVGTSGAGDEVTTNPPPGMDTTGNPCIEWWEDYMDDATVSDPAYLKTLVAAAAHTIFMQFKCDVARSQQGN